MKSILLPTDFSKNSINAIEYAVNLFKDEPVEFFVLNIQKASTFVSDDLMSMTASTTIYQTLIDTAKKSINNLITTIKAKYPNPKHEFHPVVDYDNFIDGINQMCHAVSGSYRHGYARCHWCRTRAVRQQYGKGDATVQHASAGHSREL